MKKFIMLLLVCMMLAAGMFILPVAAEEDVLNEPAQATPVFNVFGAQTMTENADGSISVTGTAAWRYGISSNKNIFLNPFSTKVKFDTANTDISLSVVITHLRHGYYSDAGNEVLAVVLQQQSSSIAVDVFDNSGETILEKKEVLQGKPTETWVTVSAEVTEEGLTVKVNEIEFSFTDEQFDREIFSRPMFLKYGLNSVSQTATGGFTVGNIDWGDAPENFSEDVYGNLDGLEAMLDDAFGTQPLKRSYALPVVFVVLAGVGLAAGCVFALLSRRKAHEKK